MSGTGRLNGRSEALLGRFMREYPGSQATKENLHIATKFAAYPWRLTSGDAQTSLMSLTLCFRLLELLDVEAPLPSPKRMCECTHAFMQSVVTNHDVNAIPIVCL